MPKSTLRGAEELCTLGVVELGRSFRSRTLSPVEVTRATVERIERLNPQLNAFISVLGDQALAAAKAVETQFASGIDLGPMQGITFSVKDIMTVRDTRTTAASKILQHAPPDCDFPAQWDPKLGIHVT